MPHANKHYNKKHNVIDYNKPLYLKGGSHFMKTFQKEAYAAAKLKDNLPYAVAITRLWYFKDVNVS